MEVLGTRGMGGQAMTCAWKWQAMDVTPPQYAQIHLNKTAVDQSNVFALLEQLLGKLPSVTFTLVMTPPAPPSQTFFSVINLFSHTVIGSTSVFQLTYIV